MEQIDNNSSTRMENNAKNNALILHLSALIKYVFPFPLISIILPLVLWQSLKKENEFIDHHGKEAVNFNLSFLLYNIVLFAVLFFSIFKTIFSLTELDYLSQPAEFKDLIFSVSGIIFPAIVFSIVGIVKIILILIAAIKASQGEKYKYPLTIRFIR